MLGSCLLDYAAYIHSFHVDHSEGGIWYSLHPCLCSVQVQGHVSPVSSLTLTALNVDVTPGSMLATANGTVSGVPVEAQLQYAAPHSGAAARLGSISLTCSAGAGLEALLTSQSSVVAAELGFSVPRPPAGGYSNSSSPTTAELVYDSAHGLRMLNISLAPSSKLSLGDLARRVGFPWEDLGTDGADVVGFTGPQVYFVPRKSGAPALFWKGRQLPAFELGVAAMVDVPLLGVHGTSATLLVQPGRRLTIQVRCWAHCTCHGP